MNPNVIKNWKFDGNTCGQMINCRERKNETLVVKDGDNEIFFRYWDRILELKKAKKEENPKALNASENENENLIKTFIE